MLLWQIVLDLKTTRVSANKLNEVANSMYNVQWGNIETSISRQIPEATLRRGDQANSQTA